VVNDLLADINYIDVGNSSNPLVRIVNQIPLVKNLVRSTKKMISKYEKVSKNVDDIILRLDKCRLTLYKDNVALDTMFKNNVEFIHELNAHILAAELKMEELVDIFCFMLSVLILVITALIYNLTEKFKKRKK
jgi:hypothetical protein